MPIPLFDLTRQNNAIMDELLAASARVLQSGQFILGDEIASLETEAAQALSAPQSLTVSSGTDALLLALLTAGIGPDDEVIVPDFTFFATAGCVARTGARPVFADICPLTYNLLPESVEERITERTRAIIPVHLFGQSADMTALTRIAEKHDLVVIEDCAQSIGAKHHGAVNGTIGDYGAISFFPTKNLGGFGDGGLVLAKDEEDHARAKVLRVHGMEPKYYHPMVGGNFRMDALQAALLRVKIPLLDQYNQSRRANAAFYLESLSKHENVWAPAATTLLAPPAGTRLITPLILPHNETTWNQFTVRIPGEDQRDSFRAHLQAAGIGTEIYYPLPLSQQECFENFAPHHCPNAATVAKECVSIPIFPELTKDELSQVADSISTWLNG